MYLRGELITPWGPKPVALKCFFRIDTDSFPMIEVNLYFYI